MSKDSEHLKKACEYAIDLIKQFLTLAAAGIAFVVGLVFSDQADLLKSGPVQWSLILFALSLLCGWTCYMNIIGRISKKSDYDIYHGFAQTMSIMQIILFAAAIGVLFNPTIKNAGHHKAAEQTSKQ